MFPSDYICFGCGTDQVVSQNDQLSTRTFMCFLWVHPQPIHSFPRLDCQAFWTSTPTPRHHSDLYCVCACLPLVQPPIWYQKQVVGCLPLSNYLAKLAHAQCKTPPPVTVMANGGDFCANLWTSHLPCPNPQIQQVACSQLHTLRAHWQSVTELKT